ncbi:MAG TPA: crosslink repair DNA glycosylase YcaQ family protein [Polyangia bacterium]
MPTPDLADLRRYAVARSLFTPTTLPRAIAKLGFVQADPIRAPARAQDLTLRHRVEGYRAGDLERGYARLGLEEDVFVNYGFLSREHHALMHPRAARRAWTPARRRQAQAVLEFVRARGSAHPREVDAHFAHGKVTNWFGGSSNASTQLLDEMHYRGLLRVVRREGGVRVYGAREPHGPPPDETQSQPRMDALVDILVRKYAPLPGPMLNRVVTMLRAAVPQWAGDRKDAQTRARQRHEHARVDGMDWYWPAGEKPARHEVSRGVRLLAPFDPVVWDRMRFEAFWGWAYRFEAYTPAPRRKLGYYALPLLWDDQVIGWGNVRIVDGRLDVQLGYVKGAPRSAVFRSGLEEETQRLAAFLGL